MKFAIDLTKIAPLNDSDEEDDVEENIMLQTVLTSTGKSTVLVRNYTETGTQGVFEYTMTQPSGGTDYTTIKKSKKFVFVPIG